MILPDWTPQLYPLMNILALATGLWLKKRQPPDQQLTPLEQFWVGFAAFVGAMTAARLPFVLAGIHDGQELRSLIFGGKTILAGLVGGYLAVELAKKILGIRTRTGDSFVVPVAGSIAVGRLSCFVGACCFGIETRLPWGVVFPTVDMVARHPTQLYEFLFHSLAAIVFAIFRSRGFLKHRLFRLYLVAYCVFRFSSEYLRPEARLWCGLTAYQWSAALMAAIFVALLIRDTDTPPPAVARC